MKTTHVLNLVSVNVHIQLAHWQADSRSNEHRTLGDLYEAMTGLTDELAEIAMGKLGVEGRAFPEGSMINLQPGTSLPELFEEAFKFLGEIRADLEVGVDDDLLNIVADMSTALNQAKYLLML